MSLEVLSEAHHQLTYSNNVKMVAQQTRRTLREAVTEAPCDGEAHNVADLVGSVDAVESDARERRNLENVPKNSRRWVVFPTETESGQYIDKAEKLKKAMDPTSIYVRTHTLAVQRGIGDKILGVRKEGGVFKIRPGGILGTAVDGKTPGGSTKALPAANYIAAGGSGLTLKKLITSKEKLAEREFGLDDDDNEMFCAIGPKQVSDLLGIADGDGTSLNAFQQMQLRAGKPTPLMGYTWIVTNRLPKDDNDDRLCPVWAKRNIVAGIWQDVLGRMWNDTSAKNTPYAHVGALVDVVRVEDGGVEVITCEET